MRVYMSGEENLARPEVVLGDKANIMLTFWMICKKDGKPDARFKKIIKARKLKRKGS